MKGIRRKYLYEKKNFEGMSKIDEKKEKKKLKRYKQVDFLANKYVELIERKRIVQLVIKKRKRKNFVFYLRRIIRFFYEKHQPNSEKRISLVIRDTFELLKLMEKTNEKRLEELETEIKEDEGKEEEELERIFTVLKPEIISLIGKKWENKARDLEIEYKLLKNGGNISDIEYSEDEEFPIFGDFYEGFKEMFDTSDEEYFEDIKVFRKAPVKKEPEPPSEPSEEEEEEEEEPNGGRIEIHQQVSKNKKEDENEDKKEEEKEESIKEEEVIEGDDEIFDKEGGFLLLVFNFLILITLFR